MADKEANNPAKGHTVVAFLIFPTRHNSFNVDSLKGQAITKQLRYVQYILMCCIKTHDSESRGQEEAAYTTTE